MADGGLYALAERLGTVLGAQGKMLVTAESCTGGWIGEAVTMVPGSSGWYERGFITYTNVAKEEMLGVRTGTLAQHGAVSEQTVLEMTAGALRASHAHVAVAVSGVAGPSGGTHAKPVGTVCIAWADRGGVARAETRLFDGDRASVRLQSVARALEGMLEMLTQQAASSDCAPHR